MNDELVIKCMDYISTFSTRGLEYFIDTSDRENINDWTIYTSINISINTYNGWWFPIKCLFSFHFQPKNVKLIFALITY